MFLEAKNAYKAENYNEAIEKCDLALELVYKILSYDENFINPKGVLCYYTRRAYHKDNNLQALNI